MSDWQKSMICIAVFALVWFIIINRNAGYAKIMAPLIEPSAGTYSSFSSNPADWKVQHQHDTTQRFKDDYGQWWECEQLVSDRGTGSYEEKCRKVSE